LRGSIGGQTGSRILQVASACRWHMDSQFAHRYRLYLPEIWANDSQLRQQAKIRRYCFQTSWRSRSPDRQAIADGIPREPCWPTRHTATIRLSSSRSKTGTELCAGIQSTTTVWPPGTQPLPAPEYAGRGRPATCAPRRGTCTVSAKQLALSLPANAWRNVTWPKAHVILCAPASCRTRSPCTSHHKLQQPREQEWPNRVAPQRNRTRKYWMSNLPERPGCANWSVWRNNAGSSNAIRRTETGTRPGPLRRPRLARLPSSRHTLYRAYGFLVRSGVAFPLGPQRASWTISARTAPDFKPRGSHRRKA